MLFNLTEIGTCELMEEESSMTMNKKICRRISFRHWLNYFKANFLEVILEH